MWPLSLYFMSYRRFLASGPRSYILEVKRCVSHGCDTVATALVKEAREHMGMEPLLG